MRYLNFISTKKCKQRGEILQLKEDNMFVVDSHCHLDSLDFNNKTIDDVISAAQNKGVKHLLSVATTLSGYQSMRDWLMPYKEIISYSCGVHPLNIEDELFDFNRFALLADEDNVVALGETGLDYYYRQDNMKEQKHIFREHIRLGRELKKPVIVHTRNAKQDTLAMLKSENVFSGVLHCFTEDLETAKKVLDMGMYISFSGIVTFKNAEALREVARYVPLDKLLVETDSPYLAPVPYRGKENHPANVRTIAEYLSIVKGVSFDEFARNTTKNFAELFNLPGIINEI